MQDFWNPNPDGPRDTIRLIRTEPHRPDELPRWYRERADGVRERLDDDTTLGAEMKYLGQLRRAMEEAQHRNTSWYWIARRWVMRNIVRPAARKLYELSMRIDQKLEGLQNE